MKSPRLFLAPPTALSPASFFAAYASAAETAAPAPGKHSHGTISSRVRNEATDACSYIPECKRGADLLTAEIKFGARGRF